MDGRSLEEYYYGSFDSLFSRAPVLYCCLMITLLVSHVSMISCGNRGVAALQDSSRRDLMVMAGGMGSLLVADSGYHYSFWHSGFDRVDAAHKYLGSIPGVLVVSVSEDYEFMSRVRQRVRRLDDFYMIRDTSQRNKFSTRVFSSVVINGKIASPSLSGCVVVLSENGDFVIDDVRIFNRLYDLYRKASRSRTVMTGGPGVDDDDDGEILDVRREALRAVRDTVYLAIEQEVQSCKGADDSPFLTPDSAPDTPSDTTTPSQPPEPTQ